MNHTMSDRHPDTTNVASAGIIDFCPSLNLALASDRATKLFAWPTTCRARGIDTEVSGIAQRFRLKRDEWRRLERDDLALKFMRDRSFVARTPQLRNTYTSMISASCGTLFRSCTARWGPERMSHWLIAFAVKDPNRYELWTGCRIDVGASPMLASRDEFRGLRSGSFHEGKVGSKWVSSEVAHWQA